MRIKTQAPAAISPEMLARLWPNRVHESNWLKSLACRMGLHRWHEMKFEGSAQSDRVRFCRWCAKLKTQRDSSTKLELALPAKPTDNDV